MPSSTLISIKDFRIETYRYYQSMPNPHTSANSHRIQMAFSSRSVRLWKKGLPCLKLTFGQFIEDLLQQNWHPNQIWLCLRYTLYYILQLYTSKYLYDPVLKCAHYASFEMHFLFLIDNSVELLVSCTVTTPF